MPIKFILEVCVAFVVAFDLSLLQSFWILLDPEATLLQGFRYLNNTMCSSPPSRIMIVGKLSWLPSQLRKPRKFSPSNDLPCTVLGESQTMNMYTLHVYCMSLICTPMDNYLVLSYICIHNVTDLLPPLFFLGASSGLGNGLTCLTGGGSCILSNFFCTSSLRAA